MAIASVTLVTDTPAGVDRAAALGLILFGERHLARTSKAAITPDGLAIRGWFRRSMTFQYQDHSNRRSSPLRPPVLCSRSKRRGGFCPAGISAPTPVEVLDLPLPVTPVAARATLA